MQLTFNFTPKINQISDVVNGLPHSEKVYIEIALAFNKNMVCSTFYFPITAFTHTFK
jgi:hypothetical protein